MICRDFLSYWKKCVGIDSENNKCIYFNESRGTLIEREKQLEKIIYYLSLDSDCLKAALPFLCQYMFPLLDCTSDVIYTPSREDCIDIKTKTCSQLWKLAVGYGFGSVLPKCQNLNLASATISSEANNESSTSSTSSDLTCRKGFYKADVICLPRCDKFEDSTSKTSEFILKAEVVASIFAMTVSAVVLILSAFSYKTMFVYPSILIIFMTIDCGIVGLLGFMIALDRNKLMCSSKDLLESLKQSTPFCILSAKADNKAEAMNEFFKCEALGYVPGNCDEGKHERIIYPYINVIVYTSVNLVPLVTLIYVVKWAWIKKVYKYLYDKIFPKSKRRLQYGSSSSFFLSHVYCVQAPLKIEGHHDSYG
uniref:FZ domain-containing protein n=1 Tax=Amphimedon queenslandica TaxID=400682 RepID=A0A1X7VWC8_AMPQE